jgi:hypothetical protein
MSWFKKKPLPLETMLASNMEKIDSLKELYEYIEICRKDVEMGKTAVKKFFREEKKNSFIY